MESVSKNEIDPDSDRSRAFDEIMSQVGYSGPFQKRFNIIFNLVFIVFATMASFNIVLALAVPGHWCHVPGQDPNINSTLDKWKTLNIPRDNGSNNEDFSQCEMFREAYGPETIECQHGWDFNKTYYKSTIASDQSWVCTNDIYVTNSFLMQRLGEVIGTFLFGQMGDTCGRRPVFYLSLLLLVLGRLLMVFTVDVFYLFAASIIIGNLSGMSLFQASLVIAMEIGTESDRTYVAMLQSVAWTIGLCLVPFIYWLVGDWIPFMVWTTAPLVAFFAFYRYMVESPRWLATKGRPKQCLKVLKRISKVNRTKIVSDKILFALQSDNFQPETVYGVVGLFSTKSLTFRTIVVVIGWSCNMLIYIILFLNISNLAGNPFLNFFWQGLAELPGYILCKYACDSIGRKYSRFLSFVILTVVSGVLSCIILIPGCETLVSILAIILKLVCSGQFYIISLHTLEMYPTCLRQTGTSMGYFVASIVGLVGPYVIYLGTVYSTCVPYVISTIVAVIGAIFGMMLPETLNERLPETVKEAEQFGRDQTVWELPKKRRRTNCTIVMNDFHNDPS